MRNPRVGDRNRCFALAALLAVVVAGGASSQSPAGLDWRFDPAGEPRTIQPPTPGAMHDVELVLDDGVIEGDFGIGVNNADQFLWMNQFTPAAARFDLDEIHVAFPASPNLPVGAAIQLVVYLDADRDPANGADLLLAFDDVVQFNDGATFSVYQLDPPLPIRDPGDVLIGVVSRFVNSGVSPPVSPAAIDTTASQGRSWVATWLGDPPDPPLLPPDGVFINMDLLLPGNFAIRAFGGINPLAIPALGESGLAALILLLSVFAFLQIRRQA